tara:strand:+ start:2987 stop:3238 length:252 start_codon:yes stop_codon:yes gene_type:complete
MVKFLIKKDGNEVAMHFEEKDLDIIKKNNNMLIFDKKGIHYFKNNLMRMIVELCDLTEKDKPIQSIAGDSFEPQDLSKNKDLT